MIKIWISHSCYAGPMNHGHELGTDQKMILLMPQNFEEEDHLKFIEDIMPFFKDERYIKIDNCPILIIYRPQYIPKEAMNAAIKVWRDYVKQNGFDDLYLINAEAQVILMQS